MSVLFVAVPVALLLVTAAVLAFLWAVRGGQLDDLETPAMRMLHDDEAPGRRNASPGDDQGLERPSGDEPALTQPARSSPSSSDARPASTSPSRD